MTETLDAAIAEITGDEYTPTPHGRITDVEKFLEKCREEFTEDFRRDKLDREEGEADNDFANSSDASKSQWNPDAFKARSEAKKPILQFNKLPIYLQHVSNSGRQNQPSIKITAGDDGKPETAEMWESRIRQVEYQSDASTVWDTAREQQTSSGRAAVRIITEIVKGKQVARIKRIENQFSVIWGPHREYDASDADRCWVITYITKAEHRRLYGKNSLLNRTDFKPFEGSESWVDTGPNNEMVQIAEKFCREYDDKGNLEGVYRYVINGAEILDPKPDDPDHGKFIVDDIPIVPQWGREAVVNGVTRHFSLVNPAKDWQRLVNLYGSNIAMLIGAAPTARYMAEVGSIAKDHEDAYGSNSPKSILYWVRQQDGMPHERPELVNHEPAIQAASEGLQQAIEGMKSSMGIFDASIGARSNEVTGVAQQRRQQQSEVTNYHFPSNEERTRKRVGQILLKIEIVLNKGAKSLQVRHENGKTESVPIGTPYKDRKGKEITHEIDDADYGVEVESGPSYASAVEQKEEAQQALIAAVPDVMMSEVGVNWIRNSRRPGADEDADAWARKLNMMFPGLIPDKDQPQIPPQVAQQMQAMQQKLQTTEAFAQSLHEQIQTKQVENQAKVQIQQQSDSTKLEIAKMQEETKRVLGLATIQSQEALAKLEHELGIVHKQVDQAHESTAQATEHAHSDASQASDQAHAKDTQTTDLAASAASQGAAQEHEATQAEQAQEAAAAQSKAGA